MMEITININCPALDRLAEALRPKDVTYFAKTLDTIKALDQAGQLPLAPIIDEGARVTKMPDPVQQSAPESSPEPEIMREEPAPTIAPTYTLADMQRACGDLRAIKGAPAPKDFIGSFGAAKLSEVPADRYGEMAEQLRKVGVKI